MHRPISSLVFLLLFLVPPAFADMDEARQAYAEGRWQDAAAHGQLVGDSDGYAFAAGALIAQLMVEFDHPNREALLEQAQRFADEAYRQDRHATEARLRMAAVIGYRGRFVGGWRAYLTRMPQRGRNLIESVIEENPSDAWALGMLGAWNLEVARRGGDRGLRALDASVETGIGLYSQAIALEPANPAPRYFLALGLIALGEHARYPTAYEQLNLALATAPRDAFETGILAEARLLSAVLQDQPREAEAWANDRMTR
jgi:tetratricopeptide (TPR) repeat protein